MIAQFLSAIRHGTANRLRLYRKRPKVPLLTG